VTTLGHLLVARDLTAIRPLVLAPRESHAPGRVEIALSMAIVVIALIGACPILHHAQQRSAFAPLKLRTPGNNWSPHSPQQRSSARLSARLMTTMSAGGTPLAAKGSASQTRTTIGAATISRHPLHPRRAQIARASARVTPTAARSIQAARLGHALLLPPGALFQLRLSRPPAKTTGMPVNQY